MSVTRRALAVLGVVGFLCRALVPLGLMPAPAAAGGPFVFCHGGTAGAFFRALAAEAQAAHAPAHDSHTHAAHQAHAGHEPPAGAELAQLEPDELALHAAAGQAASDEGAADEHLGWQNCAFGAAFAQAALASTFDVPLLALEHSLVRLEPYAYEASLFASPYRARAPPRQPA